MPSLGLHSIHSACLLFLADLLTNFYTENGDILLL
jgi:hypothetical protein